MRKTSYKKVTFTILTILWMVLIFTFSAAPSEESEEMSRSAGQAFGRIFVPGYETWDEQKQDTFAETIDYPVRKCAHATEYAVLGVLLALMLEAYEVKNRKQVLLAILLGVLYASSDEFHQLFVPGRAGHVTDVLIDSAGLCLGIGVKTLICSIKNP